MRAAGIFYVMEKRKKIQDPEIEWETKHRKRTKQERICLQLQEHIRD